MSRSRLSPFRIAGGLLLSAAVFACDGTVPLAVEDSPQHARLQFEECTNVTLDGVYSGPPAREHGLINLNDPWVFVEVLDVQRFMLPRQRPAASDVRMGDDWETGTPAESYQVLDIDNDGRLDIRLVFSKSRLVADGNLDQETTEVQVWGLDRARDGTYCGSEPADVFLPPPPPGQDVVVFNDLNPFDNTAMTFGATDNVQMVRNLVTFTSEGPRNEGTVVMWDRGRNSRCIVGGTNWCSDAEMAVTRSTITDEGFTISDIFSSGGTLVNIPANVKSIWLWLPTVFYTNAEINALKQFAVEGGRIMFIGEWDDFYTAQGLAVQNDFLAKMGAVMRNTGGAVNCEYTTLPSASIVHEHQVTEDVNSLRIACASVIAPGPQDFILFYDTSRTRVLAGVARIDPTPLSGREVFTQQVAPVVQFDRNLNPNSPTGRW